MTKAPPAWQLVLISLPQPFALNMILPGLKEFGAAFGLTVGEAAFFVTAFAFGMGFGHLVLSPLSDRYGRRPVLLGGLALFTTATLLAIVLQSASLMLAVRFLQGASSVAGLAMARAMLRDTLPPREAASGIAVLLLGMSLGPLLGPVLGGVLSEHLPWQMLFVVMAALNLPALWVAFTACAETHAPTRGNVLVQSARNMRALLRDLSFRPRLALQMLAGAMYFLGLVSVTQVGLRSFALSPSEISLAYLLCAAGTMAGAALSSRLVLRMSLQRAGICGILLSSLGLGLSVASVCLMPSLPLAYFGAIALVQLGVAVFLPVSVSLVLQVPSDRIGSASGLGASSQMFTGSLVTAAFGGLITALPQVEPVVVFSLAMAAGFALAFKLLRAQAS